MGKNIKVAALNDSTLQLLEDAKSGDCIDLKSITQIDTSIIVEQINKEKDAIYTQKFEEYKLSHNKDIELAVAKSNKESDAEKTKLLEKITELTTKNEQLEKAVRLSVEKEYNDKLFEYKERLLEANNLLDKKETEFELRLEKELNKQKDDFNDILGAKEKEINRLTLSANRTNTKALGEQLEVWCSKKMDFAMQNAFEECKWEKDNVAVKNEFDDKKTKADFIFTIYKDENHNEKEVLSSVCLEMKNEFIGSENKKKNSDHYAKLDQDRNKKNCEYALLVSELEWDVDDDMPFFKVAGYEKMYVVRPQYFVEFLTIIESFALKTQDLKEQLNKKKVEFESTDKIIKEFEDFKEGLLNNQLHRISENIEKIKAESLKIANSVQQINKTCETISTSYLNEIVNKVNKLSIEKLTKKIEQL